MSFSVGQHHMSAAFRLNGALAWGTNGAVGRALNRLVEEAVSGQTIRVPEHVLADMRETRDGFFPGIVIDLGPWLAPSADARAFSRLLEQQGLQFRFPEEAR